jgi:hypothetical protein
LQRIQNTVGPGNRFKVGNQDLFGAVMGKSGIAPIRYLGGWFFLAPIRSATISGA